MRERKCRLDQLFSHVGTSGPEEAYADRDQTAPALSAPHIYRKPIHLSLSDDDDDKSIQSMSHTVD
jgi:hypothetical protein